MFEMKQWSVWTLAAAWAGIAAAQPINVQQDFAGDPAAAGWAAYGDTNLFHWNPVNQNLEVTWDSSRTNSYFCHPLGTTLGADDDFTVSFDLQIQQAAIVGYGFELAIGLLNLSSAMQPGFLRGTGNDTPNLVEFDYFPDPDGLLWWGPSLTMMMVDSIGTNSSHWSLGGYVGVELPANDVLRVQMAYSGANRRLQTTITNLTSGGIVGPVPDAVLPPTFLSFYVDHIAVTSYSDRNGWGSLTAEGTVDNISVTATPQVAPRLRGGFGAGGVWETAFLSHSNRSYTLQRTINFDGWTNVAGPLPGTEGEMVMQDTNTVPVAASYRVRVE